jgi:hypothetical protein
MTCADDKAVFVWVWWNHPNPSGEPYVAVGGPDGREPEFNEGAVVTRHVIMPPEPGTEGDQ